MKKNRIVYFCFFFFSFTCSCFAYSIEPYLEEESRSQSSQVLNLVFVPYNYTKNSDFTEDIGIMIQRLKRTKPFDEFIKTISLYYINLTAKEESVIFKKRQDFPPIKVLNDFLDEISDHLNASYKIVIIDAKGSVSCAELSSIDKLSLIIVGKRKHKDTNSLANGFLHELGHSLGLRDESPNSAILCPAGKPNCAVTMEQAQEWWGDLAEESQRVGYIRGCCGNKEYIRPTIASIMNDLDKAGDFGPVNERYLRDVMKERI